MAIKHSITLSTTEPNNEVGVIKIRQADEQTQMLDVQITENGVPKSYTGLAVYFCAKLGQTAGLGIIEQKLKPEEMTNPANGKLEYTMRAEDWQILGRQRGYFSFRKMKDEHEFVEQFTTRDFTYNVIPSVTGEIREVKKDGSTYIWTIEEMIRLFKEYISTGKIDWENYKNDERILWEKFVEDNREFLETADPGGKIILELSGARGGAQTLGERLDSEKAEVTAQLAQIESLSKKINAQTNFVDVALKSHDPYTKMRFLKISNTSFQVQVHDDKVGVIYSFLKDANDDFIKLSAVYKGTINPAGKTFEDKADVSTENTTGTWSQSGVSWFTRTINDTFTEKVVGEEITLTIHKEPRGGIWSVKVDNRPPITVSCYSSTIEAQDVVIATGLPNIEHTVVCTFLGDDPSNSPSENPSRGYVRFVGEAQKGTLTGYKTSERLDVSGTYLAENSNKEFAFIPIKNGKNNWVPEHNGIGSCFNLSDPEIIIDGQPVDINSLGTGSSNAININHFELKQHFYANVDEVGPVADMKTSHKIDKRGLMDFDGQLEATDAFEMSVFYPLMLPASAAQMNDFVSGIFNKKTNDKTESYSYFTEEQDGVYNGAIISSTNRDMFVAGKLKSPIKTYRIGEDGKPDLDKSLFLWNRVNQPKLYFQSMANRQMAIGDLYFWGFELIAVSEAGIYDKLNS